MKGRFCHICGRVTKELYENKCRSCFVKEKSFLEVPEISLRTCRECMRYYRRGKWQKTGGAFEGVLKQVSKNAVLESMKVEMDSPDIKISCSEPEMASNKVYNVNCTTIAKGEVSGIPVEEEATASVKITLELCRDCSRRAGGYFEAILQLRGRKDLVAKGADSLNDLLTSDQKSQITSVKSLKEGSDLYFASTAVARKSAKQLMERFGGTIKESAHLHTKDKSGHDVYRVTISLRLPKFMKHDVITLESRTYQVAGFGGGKVSLFDLEERGRKQVAYKSLEKGEMLAGETVKATVLEAIPGRVQVMESKNYKTLEFRLDVPLKAKDEVNIFIDGKEFLLLTESEYQ
jgi:nonsense-mediated mRNA decay protein 3